jgi:hypothetical protein
MEAGLQKKPNRTRARDFLGLVGTSMRNLGMAPSWESDGRGVDSRGGVRLIAAPMASREPTGAQRRARRRRSNDTVDLPTNDDPALLLPVSLTRVICPAPTILPLVPTMSCAFTVSETVPAPDRILPQTSPEQPMGQRKTAGKLGLTGGPCRDGRLEGRCSIRLSYRPTELQARAGFR